MTAELFTLDPLSEQLMDSPTQRKADASGPDVDLYRAVCEILNRLPEADRSELLLKWLGMLENEEIFQLLLTQVRMRPDAIGSILIARVLEAFAAEQKADKGHSPPDSGIVLHRLITKSDGAP